MKKLIGLLVLYCVPAIAQLGPSPSVTWVAELPAHTFAAMQVDDSSNLLVGTGTATPTVIKRPPAAACVAQKPDGTFAYCQMNDSGELLTTGSGGGGAPTDCVQLNGYGCTTTANIWFQQQTIQSTNILPLVIAGSAGGGTFIQVTSTSSKTFSFGTGGNAFTIYDGTDSVGMQGMYVNGSLIPIIFTSGVYGFGANPATGGTANAGFSSSGAGVVNCGDGTPGAQSCKLGLGSLVATAAAPTVAASQIGYGSTTAAASSCGSLAGAAGCVVINVAGTNHFLPYY